MELHHEMKKTIFNRIQLLLVHIRLDPQVIQFLFGLHRFEVSLES